MQIDSVAETVPDFELAVREFSAGSRTVLPPIVSPARIESLAANWLAFNQLSQEEKNRFGLDPDEDGDIDTGYSFPQSRIETAGQPKDAKDYFHYRSGLKIRMRKECGDLPKELEAMLDDCEVINNHGINIAKVVISNLNKQFPGIYYKFFPPGSENCKVVLRLILYHESADQLIARHHVDKSGLTFQWAESRGGLHVGKVTEWPFGDRVLFEELSLDDQRRWLDKFLLPVKKKDPYELLVFPGRKMSILTGGKIPELYHKVADPESVNPGYRRWSIVQFFHPDGVRLAGRNSY